MNIHKKDFYLLTYTKGTSGKLNREFSIEINKLKAIRYIININKQQSSLDPLLIERNFLSSEEAFHVGASIRMRPKVEQYYYSIRLSSNQSYVLQEIEKPIPWVLLEEHHLNIGTTTLRDIFKNDPYHQNPNDAQFKPNINRNERYAIQLQPYLNFKFKLNKYDYWINHRWYSQAINEMQSCRDSDFVVRYGDQRCK